MRWLILVGLCGLAATCGQKGPLELPDEQSLAAGLNAIQLRPDS